MGAFTSRLLKPRPVPPGVLYLDTNAWVNLCRQQPSVSRQRVSDEILSRELCLGIGQQTLAELSDWPGLHQMFLQLISLWPTAILKINDDITTEEIARYPREGKVELPVSAIPFGVLDDVEQHPVYRALRSDDARTGRELQKQNAKKMAVRLDEVRDNFGRSGDGKFSLDRAGEFADLLAFQMLASRDLEFVKTHAGDGTRVLDTAAVRARCLLQVLQPEPGAEALRPGRPRAPRTLALRGHGRAREGPGGPAGAYPQAPP
jgi:hypothetical protein